MKKAQITMETLLLYGAAILVVLLAIAALAWFGVLDLGGMLPDKCDLSGTSTFKCEEWQVKDDNVEISIRNTASKGVEILGATFATSDSAVVDNANSGNCQDDSGTDIDSSNTIKIIAGKTSIIYCPVDILGEKGDRMKGQISIDHKYTDGALESTTIGTVTARITSS